MRVRHDSGRAETARGPRRPRAGAGSSPRSRPGSARRRATHPRRSVTLDPPSARGKANNALTLRAAILAVAVASVALALALPLKVYLGQRSDISLLEQQTQQQKARVAALQEQQRQWSDPAFIKAQARERLHFVLPGETAYIVLDSPSAAGGSHVVVPGKPQTALDASQPWYSQLWHTVEAAGHAPVATPAKR